jgi:hypothetical protein
VLLLNGFLLLCKVKCDLLFSNEGTVHLGNVLLQTWDNGISNAQILKTAVGDNTMEVTQAFKQIS